VFNLSIDVTLYILSTKYHLFFFFDSIIVTCAIIHQADYDIPRIPLSLLNQHIKQITNLYVNVDLRRDKF